MGAADRPEHARALEPRSHHRFAAGFDDSGADKEVLLAELRLAHAFGIFFKVVCLDTNCRCQLRIFWGECSQFGYQFLNLAVVQKALVRHHPLAFGFLVAGVKLAAEIP